MVRAFLAGTIIAIIAPLIGTFLVVRRYSLMADTLSHISLVGVALGVLFNIYPLFTAVIVTVIGALGIEFLRKRKNIQSESILALFLSGSLAVATILFSLARGVNVNITSFLFGSITTVLPTDIWYITILGFIVVAVIVLFYKELFLISHDEEFAEAQGIKTGIFNAVLITISAITVVLAMPIVGVLLIGALMVIPVLTAQQFGKSFLQTLGIAVGLSLFDVIVGLVLSYYIGIPSGGAIVLSAILLFLFSLLYRRR